jgi:hypothetical protein
VTQQNTVTGAQLHLSREFPRQRYDAPYPARFRVITLASPPVEDIYGDDFEKLVHTLDSLEVAQKTVTCAAFFEFLYNTGWSFVEPLHDLAKAQEGKPMSIGTVQAICVPQTLPYHDARMAIANFANGLMQGAISW